MENKIENYEAFTTVNRKFNIDWQKIQTLEDVKSILKGLEIRVSIYDGKIPEHLKEGFEKGFFIESK